MAGREMYVLNPSLPAVEGLVRAALLVNCEPTLLAIAYENIAVRGFISGRGFLGLSQYGISFSWILSEPSAVHHVEREAERKVGERTVAGTAP